MGGKLYIENGVLTKYDGTLLEVFVPAGVTEIGKGAFANNEYVKKIVLPKSVAWIDDDAFSKCESLETIYLNEGLMYIGVRAFYYCVNLKSVIFPKSLLEIDCMAFEGCWSITNVSFPDGITAISACSFSDCRKLRNVRFPKNLKLIDNYAFFGCDISFVNIPEGVEELGLNPFHSVNTMGVIIPRSVKKLARNTFSGCHNIKYIKVNTRINVRTFDKEIASKCHVYANRISDLPEFLRPNAAVTFVEEGGDISTRRGISHMKYIARYHSSLVNIAMVHRDLLRFMCEHKFLSAKDINACIEIANKSNDLETVVLLTNYQVNCLSEDDYENYLMEILDIAE